jgi:ADP-ribosylglycohydrolase/fructose-1,6-bisphosphatase/inositol monophosphatase family enzyme
VKNVLATVIAAVEAEGERLREEFYRPSGPRGHHGHAPIDREIEERLREKLQKLLPAAFAGEETGVAPGTQAGWTWLVDPQDGTFEFTSGRRGSSIAVALLRGGDAVLGVVHSPLAPDRGADTIAWAEGASAILRNGRPVKASLAGRRLAAGEIVWATGSSALRPATWSSAVAPARYIAMPSIAYRMARVAVGDGVATVSTHPVNEYDVAAGIALVRAAGGVVLDADGRELALTGSPTVRVSGVYAGAPEAARKLAEFKWNLLDEEPRRVQRVALAFPRKRLDTQLERAQGCLLGQVAGDSLGSLVEFKTAREIAALYPLGLHDLADGGVFHTIAGQPTDDSEMAIALARSVFHHRTFDKDRVLDAYREWMTTRPIDIGETTERGLLGLHTTESESNGSLMRVSPLGIWAAGDPERAAGAAREDSALTHRNPLCIEACAAYAAAIAVGVGGDNRDSMLRAALSEANGPALDAIKRGAGGARPDNYERRQGWVLIALQNAFYRLMHAPSLEDAVVKTVSCGGDTDTNGAVTGALLGAAYGRQAIPERWSRSILACRPIAEAGAPRPRPMPCWPDDALELAEAVLLTGLEQ